MRTLRNLAFVAIGALGTINLFLFSLAAVSA